MGHCFDCNEAYEGVFGPNFGFCFPNCFRSHYRKNVFYDADSFVESINELDSTLNYTPALDMKFSIPTDIMMKTCKFCPQNCRSCYAGEDDIPICYECMHGFLLDSDETCALDPNYDTKESVVSVRANKGDISQCDEVRFKIRPEEGYNMTELKEITWKIEIQNMRLN